MSYARVPCRVQNNYELPRGNVLGEYKDIMVGQLCYAANTFQTAEGKVDVNAICTAVLNFGVCPSLMVYAMLRQRSQAKARKSKGKDSHSHITKKLREWARSDKKRPPLFDVDTVDGRKLHVPRSLAARAAMDAAATMHAARRPTRVGEKPNTLINNINKPPIDLNPTDAPHGAAIAATYKDGATPPISDASQALHDQDIMPWDADLSFTSLLERFEPLQE